VTTRPIAHQFPGYCGGNIPRTKLAVKSERCLFALRLDVEMWWIMISEIIRMMIPKNVEMIGMIAF